MRIPVLYISVFVLAAAVVSCTKAAQGDDAEDCPQPSDGAAAFNSPERVTIAGYDDDAMEPFITRDGESLFFNNRNQPPVNTNLHWARRIDDTTFEYMGEIEGVNTAALEGVPTMDNDGNFYFVSPRDYEQTLSTIYSGRFADGGITDVALVAGISREEAPIVNFDVEVSADGDTLYFVDSRFGADGGADGGADSGPQTADVVMAVRGEDGFERLSNSDDLLQAVNTDVLDYAAGISADGLELFFTRVDLDALPDGVPQIYRATRGATDERFGCVERIEAIEGFVEGPTLSPDGRSLYYHRLDAEADRFVIYRVTREVE